jgi:hypothetical protein
MVPAEVIRVEEEEYPAAGLRSNGPSLTLVGGFRKQQAAPARPCGATTTQRLPAPTGVSCTSAKPSFCVKYAMASL